MYQSLKRSRRGKEMQCNETSRSSKGCPFALRCLRSASALASHLTRSCTFG